MIKLKLGDPLYALFNEDTDEYVYLLRGDYELKPVPKPSGLAPTLEKIQWKHDGLIKLLEKRAVTGDKLSDDHLTDDQIWDRSCAMYKGFFRPGVPDITRERLFEIRAENLEHNKQNYRDRLAIAKRFIIVKLSVEKVEI